MPGPSTSLATLRPDIAQAVEEFNLERSRDDFIGNMVLPIFDAPQSSGTFGRIPVEELLANRDTERNPRSGYARGDWTFLPETYTTAEHGAEEPIDDNDRKNYKNYFDVEVISAARAVDVVLRNRERRIAAKIFNTTTWTGSSLTTAVGTVWSNVSSTPLADVEAAIRKVWTNSGIWPDTLIINKHGFRNLRLVTQIKDLIAASGAGDKIKPNDITPSMLAQCFSLRQVIVAGGTKNASNEGQAATFGKIWSDSYAMVCKVAETNDLSEPCIGRAFHWSEDGSEVGCAFETYRDERIRGDVVRARQQMGEKIIYAECGHLLSNVG